MSDLLPRKLAAILYADVAGYSRLTGEDEEGTHRRLSKHLGVISASIERHHGKVVHYAGDAVLADFGTVTEALTSAIDIQTELAKRNQDLHEAKSLVREVLRAEPSFDPQNWGHLFFNAVLPFSHACTRPAL